MGDTYSDGNSGMFPKSESIGAADGRPASDAAPRKLTKPSYTPAPDYSSRPSFVTPAPDYSRRAQGGEDPAPVSEPQNTMPSYMTQQPEWIREQPAVQAQTPPRTAQTVQPPRTAAAQTPPQAKPQPGHPGQPGRPAAAAKPQPAKPQQPEPAYTPPVNKAQQPPVTTPPVNTQQPPNGNTQQTKASGKAPGYGLGIASLVIGVASLLFGFYTALVPPFIGIMLGRAGRKLGNNTGVCKAGIVTSSIALAIGILAVLSGSC